MALSLAQVRAYAEQAGFRGIERDIIVAIAFAESGFRVNPPSPPGVYGILQFKPSTLAMVGHPPSCALDPACSFAAAYARVRQVGGFGDWETYTTGAYRPYLSHPPDPGGGGVNSVPVVGGLVGGAGAAAGAVGGAAGDVWSGITGAPGAVLSTGASDLARGMTAGLTAIIKWIGPHILFLGGMVLTGYLILKELEMEAVVGGTRGA